MLALLAFFFFAPPVWAATSAAIVSSPSSVAIDTPFDLQISIQGDVNTTYYLKARIGASTSSLTKGLTNNLQNNSPDDWLTDNDSWSKFPIGTTNSSGSWQGSLKVKTSSTIIAGNNLLVFRIRKVGVTTTYDSLSKTITISSSSPLPTPTPTTSPNPSSTPSPAFTVSNPPSQINSDQSFTVAVNLSLPDNPNTNFYLKGAFKKGSGSNYFGETLVSGNWVKNSSTYSNQYPIKTDSSGNWSGNLEIKPDVDDGGYTGTDDYSFKVGRYSSSGSGPSWSNETTVKIIDIPGNNQGGASNTSASPTNSSSTPQTSQNSQTYSLQPKNSKSLIYHIASVAAATSSATPSASVEVKAEKGSINPILLIGVILIVSGIGSLIFIIFLKGKLTGSASTK